MTRACTTCSSTAADGRPLPIGPGSPRPSSTSVSDVQIRIALALGDAGARLDSSGHCTGRCSTGASGFANGRHTRGCRARRSDASRGRWIGRSCSARLTARRRARHRWESGLPSHSELDPTRGMRRGHPPRLVVRISPPGCQRSGGPDRIDRQSLALGTGLFKLASPLRFDPAGEDSVDGDPR
jgi:hypothetical protein